MLSWTKANTLQDRGHHLYKSQAIWESTEHSNTLIYCKLGIWIRKSQAMYTFAMTERGTNSTDRRSLWSLNPISPQVTLPYNALSWLPLPRDPPASPLQSACPSRERGTALSTRSISFTFLQVLCSWQSLNHPAEVQRCMGPCGGC